MHQANAEDAGAVLALLRARYGDLSPQLRRAARFVLDRPDEVAVTSMRTAAARAGVQPATMVRLAKHIGFPGYGGLRAPLQERLLDRPGGYRQRAQEIQARSRGVAEAAVADDGFQRLAVEMFTADRENLSASLVRMRVVDLVAAGRAAATARSLYVVGLRSLYPAAFYVHYACRMFRDNTVLLDGSGGTFADNLRGIARHDALLVFAVDPYTRATVHAGRYAAESGATVIAVTDSIVSPVAPFAQHRLTVTAEGPAIFRSVVPAMAVAQALVALILAQSGESALDAVAESERQLESFDAYWPTDTPTDAAPVAGAAP